MKAAKLKEVHFKRDVHVCPRIDRALVYIRNNVFNSLRKVDKKQPILRREDSAQHFDDIDSIYTDSYFGEEESNATANIQESLT